MHDLLQRDARAIADIKRIRFAPATAMRGEGCWLIDADGRRVLDLSSSWGAASLGYGHPAVTEAVATAAHNMGRVRVYSQSSTSLPWRWLNVFWKVFPMARIGAFGSAIQVRIPTMSPCASVKR
jgi:adenosylmethionine-8-amino-7-oxononanoate aminotransferase